MSIFGIASALVFLAALFGYLNLRFLKLPPTIGLMIIALVLTLPPFKGRDLLLTCTYIVVLFSIIVQGLTLKPFINRIQSCIKE